MYLVSLLDHAPQPQGSFAKLRCPYLKLKRVVRQVRLQFEDLQPAGHSSHDQRRNRKGLQNFLDSFGRKWDLRAGGRPSFEPK